MEQKPRCEFCVHWESRPELEMPVGTGYCDYHEKVFRATHWCQFFLARDSSEGLQYKRDLYGADEEDGDESEEMDV